MSNIRIRNMNQGISKVNHLQIILILHYRKTNKLFILINLMLKYMTHSKTFNLKSGKSFTTLKGLAKELRIMAKDVYEHHVNSNKNDFANWAKHSLKNEKLAKVIEGQISKIELELEVLRHLVHEVEKNPVKKKITTTKKKVVKKVSTNSKK